MNEEIISRFGSSSEWSVLFFIQFSPPSFLLEALLFILIAIVLVLTFLLIRSNNKNKRLSLLLRGSRNNATHLIKNYKNQLDKKMDFMHILSHEIRTPVNSIVALTHLLMDEKKQKDQVSYLHSLHFASKNLLNLTNTFLDMSKLEDKNSPLEQRPFNLFELVNNYCAALSPLALKKGLKPICIYDDQLPHFFVGDHIKIGQVLNNLLTNAIKYTDEGKVEFSITPGANGGVHFKIQDTGRGIPEAYQKKIFEKFIQVPGDFFEDNFSTGLGLPITQKLLAMMGSQLNMQSQINKGTTFEFELSLPIYSFQQKEKSNTLEQNHEDLKGLRILVADDNLINQQAIGKLLQKWGMLAAYANDGLEAFQMWQKNTYDLIIMDLRMPNMNGFEAVEKIQAYSKASQKTPIIGLTASSMPEELKGLQSKGFSSSLSKPFHPQAFLECIRKTIEKSKNIPSEKPLSTH